MQASSFTNVSPNQPQSTDTPDYTYSFCILTTLQVLEKEKLKSKWCHYLPTHKLVNKWT